MMGTVEIPLELAERLTEIENYQDAGWFCPSCGGFAPAPAATRGVQTPVRHEDDCALEELRNLLETKS